MSSNLASRSKFTVAVVAAFLGGLLFAAGFDLTPFGYAQASKGAPTVRTAGLTSAPAPVANVAALNNEFVTIAERVTPAVVSISAERLQERRTQPQRQQRRNPGLEDFFQQFDPRSQQPQMSSGSGFIVSPDGYILTNNHVIEGMDRIRVTLMDHREFPARLVGRDNQTDVAVLKIDARGLPTTTFGDDAATRVGEWVLAIGNPLNLEYTVTAGIVSAKGRDNRDVGVLTSAYAITDMIQTDAAINPGNSGGPLVNIRGEVIGINTAIATRTGTYVGYGFAIPILLARDVMNDLIKNGRVRRAVIGLNIGDVTPEMAEAAGLKEISGVVVSGFVGDDSPARRAGIREGDIIVRADGKVADRVSTLQRIIRTHAPGETIEVEVARFGERKSFRIRLAEAPAEEAQVAENPDDQRDASEPSSTSSMSADKLGVTVENVTDAFARSARVPADQRGVRVLEVEQTAAARGRLFPDDVIVAQLAPGERRPIRSTDDLREVLSSARNGQSITFLVFTPQAANTRVVAIRVGGAR
jgi:serine protease Do